ncbi:MAG: sulfite exporter TauE/SafE family protein [Rhodocyclaceae bacterium]|nr:sulfite exporter TauE/SafE family protein [Rhodocyclaceae bacterium]
MIEYLVPAIAAFLAGILNSIAGGGTFLTFPALVYAGIPPVAANATSAVAVFPGYLGAVAGFRRELAALDRTTLVRLVILSLVGGLLGALLLLVSSNAFFSLIVPFLLLAATACFAFQEKIQRWTSSSRFAVKPYGASGSVLVAVYGGYFNGGLGIVLLALYSLWGMENLNAMNGLKNAVSFVISAISVLTFAIAGMVHWPVAVLMMVAAIAGGYAGAGLARRLSRRTVRSIVIVIGLGMSLVFFARLLN